MTHRDGFPRLSARSAWHGDARHRKLCGTPSERLGKPPSRSGGRTAGGRRKTLTMSRIARGFPATRPLARRIACPISMGHYQRSLVLGSTIGFRREKAVVARLASHLGVGGPRIAPRRAPNPEGQPAAMKWVRINEIWYKVCFQGWSEGGPAAWPEPPLIAEAVL